MILTSRSEAAAKLAAAPGTYVSRYQERDRMADPYIETTSETANRAAVAIDLADVLEAQRHGGDPDVVRALPERAWKLVAELAGQPADYVPSPKTRETVVRLLERRKRRAAEGASPFDGFPTF